MKATWQPLGDAALWARRPTTDLTGTEGFMLSRALRECPGVLDAVVTEDRVCVYFEPGSRRGDTPRTPGSRRGDTPRTPRQDRGWRRCRRKNGRAWDDATRGGGRNGQWRLRRVREV